MIFGLAIIAGSLSIALAGALLALFALTEPKP